MSLAAALHAFYGYGAAFFLPRMLDANASALMEAHLVDQGIAVNTDVTLQKIEQAGGRRRLHLSKGAAIEADAVILATGVRGNVEFLTHRSRQSRQQDDFQ